MPSTLTLTINPRARSPSERSKLPSTKSTPRQVYLSPSSTFTNARQFVANRQRLIIESDGKKVPLVDEDQTLASYGVVDGSALRLKDLGRQTAYKWLYIWEYVSWFFYVQRTQLTALGWRDHPQPANVALFSSPLGSI